MLKRMSNLMKVTLLLIVLLMAVACTTPTSTLTVDEAVAATMAAQNAVALQVQQTVDAALAEQGNNGLDLADPASGIQPVKSVPDPNTASGTPQLRVNSSSVNVRNGPGTNYPVISTLLKDSVVTAVAKNRDGSWFQIVLPGGALGWIANSVTDSVVEADMANVPVAAVIPPPPAVASTKTATPGATTTRAVTATPTTTRAATTTAPTATTTQATTTAPTATATQAGPVPIPSTIVVINNSGMDVCFLFVDLSVDPWTVDRLGSSILSPGMQISLSFPAGLYDFKAEDCSNTIIDSLSQVNVSGTTTWEIRPPFTVNPMSNIEVINNSGTEVCFLFIDPSAGPWTVDRLGNDTLPVGDSLNFTFPDDMYDFMAQDCNQNVIATFMQVNVSGFFSWDIR